MRPCIFYREPQLEIFNLKMDKFYSSKKVKRAHLGIGHSTLLTEGYSKLRLHESGITMTQNIRKPFRWIHNFQN